MYLFFHQIYYLKQVFVFFLIVYCYYKLISSSLWFVFFTTFQPCTLRPSSDIFYVLACSRILFWEREHVFIFMNIIPGVCIFAFFRLFPSEICTELVTFCWNLCAFSSLLSFYSSTLSQKKLKIFLKSLENYHIVSFTSQ